MTARPRAILVACFVLGIGGCTSATPAAEPRDAALFNADGNDPFLFPDANADATPDGGRCSDTLEKVNTGFGPLCPQTFEAALGLGCSTAAFPPATFSGVCGGLPAVALSFSTHWKLCVYDGVDAGTLVGASGENDIDSFCDQTAYVIVGGQVPEACMSNSSYFSALLSPVDASCPRGDAATEGGPDASTD